MENLHTIITFAAYLLFMLGVGAHFCKRNESLSDSITALFDQAAEK